ncbi:hypothetical protein GCM10023235_03520 [Kitasatospora terrestris]|uniref:Uncharacterized protein n=1 Tax=Kitasatospora terrestris TaxID=258051 RepID=A0ABP9D6S9_9ACTN
MGHTSSRPVTVPRTLASPHRLSNPFDEPARDRGELDMAAPDGMILIVSITVNRARGPITLTWSPDVRNPYDHHP